MLKRSERLSGSPVQLDELRSDFQRDRDRILYSAQFRRLGGITQVTTPTELNVFHNRLTHTLEVAQIARRIAERAVKQRATNSEHIDPDVCEAAGLAHDLGHPPFGHNGELTLDKLARGEIAGAEPKNSLLEGYEGNAQSLRIVLKLAVRNGYDRGLDLTAATLRATIKYPWMRGENGDKPHKFGVYKSELVDFQRIWDGLPRFNQTLEAQIMDWSDDIAYSTHDFYDFALSGIIPIAPLKAIKAPELRELLQNNQGAREASNDAFKFVSQSFKMLPDPPSSDTSRLTSASVGILKQWVSFLIARYAGKEISFPAGDGIISFDQHGCILEEVAILKALTFNYAIGSSALAIKQEGEKRILSAIFRILDESANSDQKRLLSEDARERIDILGENPTRVILDVISSMTDAQAISMFHKLTGIAPTSVLDVATTSAL